MQIFCPKCKYLFAVNETRVGQSVNCDLCGQAIALQTKSPPALPTAGAPSLRATRPLPPPTGPAPNPVPQVPPPTGPAPNPVPQVIAGRYEVRSKLGQGAFGVVSCAWDRKYKREVAVKVLLDNALADPKAVKRFLLEAEVLCGITHPNVVPLLGYGQDGPRYYIALPLIKGAVLNKLIPPDGFADPARAVRLIVTLVKALHYVHANHAILHRDIKPANTMILDGDALYLMDFGLAACQDRPRTTTLGTVMGTPAYMSPEQASGDTLGVCHASDLYGAGAVLFHLLTGTVPFPGSWPGVAGAILYREPPRPSSLRPHLDPALDDLVLKALEKAPGDRYENGQAFAEALEEWLDLTPSRAGRSRPHAWVLTAPTEKKSGPRPTVPTEVPARAAAKDLAVAAAAVAVDSVSAQPDSTLRPAVPVSPPFIQRPTNPYPSPAPRPPARTNDAAPPAPLADEPTDHLNYTLLGLGGGSLLWLVGAVLWALLSYRVFFPVVGQRAEWSGLPEENPTPKLWAYALGAALLVALLTWIVFAVRYFLRHTTKT